MLVAIYQLGLPCNTKNLGIETHAKQFDVFGEIDKITRRLGVFADRKGIGQCQRIDALQCGIRADGRGLGR